MTCSFKRTPIVGNTTARSDKPWKVAEHRRERAMTVLYSSAVAILALLFSPQLVEFLAMHDPTATVIACGGAAVCVLALASILAAVRWRSNEGER